MRTPISTFILVCAILLSGCGSSDDGGLRTCANGIVVYGQVDCDIVEIEDASLDDATKTTIETLRAEADEDPTKALGNSQSIMRLMARAPFSVCAALQSDPTGDFLRSDTIAPIAAELAETTCPSKDALST